MLLTTLLLTTTASSICQQPGPQDPGRAAAAVTNGLGIDVYRRLAAADRSGNLCLAPHSLAIACMMAAEGARDATAAEMARAMHCPDGALADVHGSFAALCKRLQAGGGDPSPELLARIDALRTQLAAANRLAAQLARDDKYQTAREAERAAERHAAELNALLPQVRPYELRNANALWVERTFELLPAYVAVVDRWYGTGGVQPLDFLRNAEASRQHINGWVEANTNRRIRDMIPRGAVGADTGLVISNAVWFLGEWAEPFQASATAAADFLLPDGQRTKVQLMRDLYRANVPYAAFSGKGAFFETPLQVPLTRPGDAKQPPATYPDDAGFTMVELPYKGGGLSMVVLAPRSPGGLATVESLLTAETLAAWLGHLQPRRVDTALPRFRVAAAMDLAEPLQALGMRRAFVSPALPDGAQFSGMTASRDPAQQLFVRGVLQKTWVEVSEKGTEAAAATSTLMAVGACIQEQTMVPFTPVFRADRPFLFLIRERQSGAILFLGRHVGA